MQLNRRDALKLISLLPAGLAMPHLTRTLQGGGVNVLVVVFDAFSACDVPLYGYERKTTPNIARLAERAIVYHNHFAGANFTTPGTASLLTGVLPWTHRAIRPNGAVARRFRTRNFFTALPNHYRIAYTHNGWAYTLLQQLRAEIDELIPRDQLLLQSLGTKLQRLLSNDEDIVSVSWERAIKTQDDGSAYSLFLSHVYEAIEKQRFNSYKSMFPLGLPTIDADSAFMIEDAVTYIADRLGAIAQPFAGYFHFLPPHAPYRTSAEFYGTFGNDGFNLIEKPRDVFAGDESDDLWEARTAYDEFILYCDKEFGRLYNALETSGVLENTWLVLTSDHGEMFERGISGHSTDTLYQPVVRVPLLIFEPGRKTRLDIQSVTSAIDVVPTLAHLAGEQSLSWTEGIVLPPFTPGTSLPDRNVYAVRAYHNKPDKPLTIASTMLVRENFKLHYYFGYPEVPSDGLVRLYDIQSDPEELVDLATTKPGTASELLHEIQTKLKEVDEPYT